MRERETHTHTKVKREMDKTRRKVTGKDKSDRKRDRKTDSERNREKLLTQRGLLLTLAHGHIDTDRDWNPGRSGLDQSDRCLGGGARLTHCGHRALQDLSRL